MTHEQRPVAVEPAERIFRWAVLSVFASLLTLVLVVAVTWAVVLLAGYRLSFYTASGPYGEYWFLVTDLRVPVWLTWSVFGLLAPLLLWPTMFGATATASYWLARYHKEAGGEVESPTCSNALRQSLRAWRGQLALCLIAVPFVVVAASTEWKNPPRYNLVATLSIPVGMWLFAVVSIGCCRLAESPRLAPWRVWPEAIRRTPHVLGPLQMITLAPVMGVLFAFGPAPGHPHWLLWGFGGATIYAAVAVYFNMSSSAYVYLERSRKGIKGAPFAKQVSSDEANEGGKDEPASGLQIHDFGTPLCPRQAKWLRRGFLVVVLLALFSASGLHLLKQQRYNARIAALQEAFAASDAPAPPRGELPLRSREVERLREYVIATEPLDAAKLRELVDFSLAEAHPAVRLEVYSDQQAHTRTTRNHLQRIVWEAQLAIEQLDEPARTDRLLLLDEILARSNALINDYGTAWSKALFARKDSIALTGHTNWPQEMVVDLCLAIQALEPIQPHLARGQSSIDTPLDDHFRVQGDRRALSFGDARYTEIARARVTLTHFHLARIALRLEAYYARHGEFPDSLDDLPMDLDPNGIASRPTALAPPSIVNEWDPTGAAYSYTRDDAFGRDTWEFYSTGAHSISLRRPNQSLLFFR